MASFQKTQKHGDHSSSWLPWSTNVEYSPLGSATGYHPPRVALSDGMRKPNTQQVFSNGKLATTLQPKDFIPTWKEWFAIQGYKIFTLITSPTQLNIAEFYESTLKKILDESGNIDSFIDHLFAYIKENRQQLQSSRLIPRELLDSLDTHQALLKNYAQLCQRFMQTLEQHPAFKLPYYTDHPEQINQDKYRAMTNFWAYLLLAYCYKKPITDVHKDILALCLLYPLTDNLMDDPTLDTEAKNNIANFFKNAPELFKSKGKPDLSQFSLPVQQQLKIILLLIKDILEIHAVTNHNPCGVLDSLHAINALQHLSAKLQQSTETKNAEAIFAITMQKGGSATVADAHFLHSEEADASLSNIEFEIALLAGGLIQHLNDIEGIEQDTKDGINTSARNHFERVGNLDAFVGGIFLTTERAIQQLALLDTEVSHRAAVVLKLYRMKLCVTALQSSAENPCKLTPEFVQILKNLLQVPTTAVMSLQGLENRLFKQGALTSEQQMTEIKQHTESVVATIQSSATEENHSPSSNALYFILALLMMLLFSQISSAESILIEQDTGTKLSANEQFISMYPMVIPGEKLSKSLWGHTLNNLSIMSVQQGQFSPIPFQFDEMDKIGRIYIKGTSEKGPAGPLNQLDASDELVFMLKDAGDSIKTLSTNNHSRILQEIIIRAANQLHYIYLVENDNQRDTIDYIHTNLKTGTIQTPTISFKFSPNNMADVQYIKIRNQNGYTQNLLGKMELSASAGIFSSLFVTKLDLKENIQAVPVGIKDGPVRATILLRTKVKWAGIPLFHTDVSMSYYPYSIKLPSRFSADSLSTLSHFVFLLRNPKVDLNIDLVNLDQGRLYFDSLNNTQTYCIIDGNMSPTEQRVNQFQLPGDWVYFQQANNTQALLSSHIPIAENGLVNEFLAASKVNYRFSYQDLSPNKIRFSFHSEGIPQLALKALPTISRLDITTEGNLKKLIDTLLNPKNSDDLATLNDITQEAILQLKQQRRIQSPTALARLLLEDLNHMNISGVNRVRLNQLIYENISRLDTLEDLTLKDQFKNMRLLANKYQIDLNQVNYSAIDSAVWFPGNSLENTQIAQLDYLLAQAPSILPTSTERIADH